jgi:hypothetical protein
MRSSLRRRLALIATMVAAGALLAGCSGYTTDALYSKDGSIKIRAQASCDGTGDPCYWYFRYYDYTAGRWYNMPVRGPVTSRASAEVSETFQPGALPSGRDYAYQLCGRGDGVKSWVCVGPNGSNTYSYFKTYPHQEPTQVSGIKG